MKMQKVKTYQYTVEGHEDVEKFAKGILALANVKSNSKDEIASFRTFNGTNLVQITMYSRGDTFIEHHVGKIRNVEEKEVLHLEWEDIVQDAQNVIGEIEDTGEEPEVIFGEYEEN